MCVLLYLYFAEVSDRHVLGRARRAVGLQRGRGWLGRQRPPAARGGGGRPERRQDQRAGDGGTGAHLPARRWRDDDEVRIQGHLGWAVASSAILTTRLFEITKFKID